MRKKTIRWRPGSVRPRGALAVMLLSFMVRTAPGCAATTGTDEPLPSEGDGGDAGGGGATTPPGPFADRVVSFSPGAHAGFGEDKLPGVVLGPPHGGGAQAGGLDVLSLGDQGCIVLQFTDLAAVDGPGADLLVFENPFATYLETGIVSVSEDGQAWQTFPCALEDATGGFPGCAGTHPVYASPDNGIDPTDPAVAGGDPYDLGDVGLAAAHFVRICDSGANPSAGTSGGFDLDAVAVVHGAAL